MEEVARRWPEANAVVLSSRAEPGDMAQALDAGIGGYLLTDMSPAALAQAIGLVALGENVFPTRLSAVLSGVPRTSRSPSRNTTLTTPETYTPHGLPHSRSDRKSGVEGK